MSDQPASPTSPGRERISQLWWRIKKATPILLGALATLLALGIYSYFSPDPDQLTTSEIDEIVAQAMGSATPPPAVSAQIGPAARRRWRRCPPG